MSTMKFNKQALIDLKPADKGYFVYDSETHGLRLRVSPTGVKSFQLQKRVGNTGKVTTITLGKFQDAKGCLGVTLATARSMAQKAFNELASGKDLNQEKRASRVKAVTVEDAFNEYMRIREAHLSKNTISNYRAIMDGKLKSIAKKPLKSITRVQVLELHRKLSQESESAANTTMRVLRAIFNFANGHYEDEEGRGAFPDNPVTALSHTRSWNREKRRSRKINNSDFPKWFEAVEAISEGSMDNSTTVSDYLKFALMTGMRRREVTELRWDEVNMEDRSFVRDKTKNGDPLILPLSDYLYDMLKERYRNRVNEYVFFGREGEGALQEPKKQIQKIKELSGIEFTSHDLRRTFLSVAESLEINYYTLKRLVNHRAGGDVTAAYISMDLERLRKPMQLITTHILKLANKEYSERPILQLVAK